MSTASQDPPSAKAPPALSIIIDDVDSAVQDAWNTASKPLPKKSQGERILDKVGDHAIALSNLATGDSASTTKVVVTNLIDGFNIDINSVKDGLRTFQQATELVMKGLDEVAKIHPFITVVVIAFKAVVTLELKRRENNGKVLALHLEMRDTMGMLLQLRSIRDPTVVTTDGTSIAGRMQEVLKRLAEDIKNCGNVCDKYMKKSTIAKIVKAPVYEQRLADCAEAFVLRRKELKMAMAIRTTLGVEAANKALDSVQQTIKTTDDKVSMLLLFQKLNSPRDRDLMKWIEGNGGADAVIKDEDLLKKLQRKADSMASPSDAAHQAKGGDSSALSDTSIARKVQSLKKELKEDFDDGLAKNMVVFGRKLDVQTQQLTVQMRAESDRVIRAFRSGAHERLVDNTLKQLWKEMGWKGSVKAKQLVLCLHEFFCEKHDQMDERHRANFLSETPIAPSPTQSVISEDITEDDVWALEFINVVHVPPIVENIDDNDSGFVSIKEANDFASARPSGWSLPHWLAFWAAAWPQSIETYRSKIYVILQRMFLYLTSVRLENRQSLETYLYSSTQWVELILRSVNTAPYASNDSVLMDKTREYIEAEENRMKEVLESIHYDIDLPSTVSLVTGPGRIEKFLFPFLYLLLRRHLEIFMLAEHYILSEEDLQIMSTSLETCFLPIQRRIENLASVFKQFSPNVSTRFRTYAFGMFEAYHNTTEIDHRSNTLAKYHYDDGFLDENLLTSARYLARLAKEKETDAANPDHDAESHSMKEGSVFDVGADPLKAVEATVLGEVGSVETTSDPISKADTTMPTLDNNDDNEASDNKDMNNSGVKDMQDEPPCSPYIPLPLPSLDILKNQPTIPIRRGFLRGELAFETTPLHHECQWPQVLEGIWSGYRAFDEPPSGFDYDSGEGLTTITFDPVVDNVLQGSAVSHYGDSEISGLTEGEESIRFKKVCVDDLFAIYFVGRFNSEKEVITGTWGYDEGVTSGSFILSRTPAWLQRYRVHNPTGSNAKDLWSFACNAVLAQVRQNLFTWSYLKARAEDRKKFVRIDLHRLRLRLEYAPRIELTKEEGDLINELENMIPGPDGDFYRALVNLRSREMVIHINAYCDTCYRGLAGLRFICVQCTLPTYASHIDLCTICRDTSPVTFEFSHNSTHDLILISTFLQDKDKSRVFDEAREKASNMKTIFRQMLASPPSAEKFEETGAFGMLCRCCEKPLTLPCWACFTCDSVLCDKCALSDEPFEPNHRYVRLHQASITTEESNAVDNRMRALEERIGRVEMAVRDKAQAYEDMLEARLSAYQTTIESKLTALEEKIDNRLASIENQVASMESLLRALVTGGNK